MKDGFELPPWLQPFQDQWDGWLAMRKAKRVPWTDRCGRIAVRCLAELKAQGFDPGEVLDQSTLRGWTGLFAIRRPTQMEHRIQDDQSCEGYWKQRCAEAGITRH